MTDADLLKLIQDGGKLEVPYFAGQLVGLDNLDEIAPEVVLPALKAFLSLSQDDAKTDARHLYAYYQSICMAVGEDDVHEEMSGIPSGPEEIWKYARPSLLFFNQLENPKYADPLTVFVVLEGRVEWEPEHGLQMSWENGRELVKAGSFDGHPTNGHAYADPSKDAFVHWSSDPEFATRADG